MTRKISSKDTPATSRFYSMYNESRVEYLEKGVSALSYSEAYCGSLKTLLILPRDL